jgi:vancomycin resistance protein VanW
LDLKVRNETEATYQLDTPDRLKLSLFSDQPCRHRYQSIDSQQHFYRQGKLVYRENHICQVQINARTGEETAKKLLYINRCQICYPLAPHTQIQELPEKREGESDEA